MAIFHLMLPKLDTIIELFHLTSLIYSEHPRYHGIRLGGVQVQSENRIIQGPNLKQFFINCSDFRVPCIILRVLPPLSYQELI